ncbi:MAG: metal-dependent hydrolase [Gallionellaceae bacterium]|jgi:L-ascorbate metabolism protein UlaG (beta-lactamase superfamily)
MFMLNVIRKLLLALLLTTPLAALAANTELTWYGHAAFKLTTPSGKVLLIDPWITNPANKNGKEDLAKITKADLILLTHGHGDHIGDSVALAKATGAKLVSTFDLGKAMAQYGGYPAEQTGMGTMGNFGGELTLLDGEVRIAFVPAVHSSTVAEAEGAKHIHDGGNPGGFLITVKNGPAIYHTGDTDVFGDMALISQFHKVDVMLATIGGHFTMGPERAAKAVKLVNPGMVIPMHFGTFPILTGTPQALEKAVKAEGSKAKVKAMNIGETIKL